MKKKILIIMTLLLLITGCTKTLVDDNKKSVINEKTGQSLTSNILCLPENKELLDKYKKYEKNMEIKLDNLTTCKNMKVYDKKAYNGLWVQIFVRPLAWLIIQFGMLVNNYGVSVMVIGLLIRLILMPFTAKSMKQTEMMKKAQPELAKLENKYKDKTDQQSMMNKSQETLMIYKKYNINPVSSCLIQFIQLPLFFAFLEAINRVPAIFENYFWKFQLGTTPLVGIKSGNFYYIILIILILLFTLLSFKNSMNSISTSPDQIKQTKFMVIFMTIFIGIASIQLPSAVALYWVVINIFSVIQIYIMKRRSEK